MELSVQPLQSDVRRIFEYEDSKAVPAPLKSALTRQEVEKFVDNDKLVTFTVAVSLDDIAQGRLYDAVVAIALSKQFNLVGSEFRAVGATFDEFDQRLCGFVHIQVTGTIEQA